VCRCQDCLAYAARRLQNVVVPKAKDTITLRLKPLGSSNIVILTLLCMLRSIKLDNDLAGVPREIRDVDSDRRLSAKMQAERLQRTQQIPKLALGIGRATTQ